MKKKWRKKFSMLLVLAVLLSMLPAAGTASNGNESYDSASYTVLATPPIIKTPIINSKISPVAEELFDGTQSAWAEKELNDAYIYGLTYPGVMSSFQKQITREEFCTIVVKLYERLSGKKAEPGADPFNDTDNPEILKAYQLKIVLGTAKDRFSPSNLITRQEICVMIFRALDVSLASLDKNASGVFPFADSSKIAPWALDSMKFAYKNEIMKGLSPTKIAPLNNTSREQAIVLLKRTLEKYAAQETGSKATIPVQVGPVPSANAYTNYKAINYKRSLAFPQYDKRLDLYVSTTAGKPAYPTQSRTGTRSTGPVYTTSSYSAFINAAGEQKRWFAFRLNNAAQASKVVWQVSRTRFNGFRDNWKNPIGLIASGVVPASAKEFQVDFAALASSVGSLGNSLDTYQKLFSGVDNNVSPDNSKFSPLAGKFAALELSPPIKITPPKTPELPVITPKTPELPPITGKFSPIPQVRSTFYVRAVPVDASGNPLGDPGEGMTVIYGKTVLNEQSKSAVAPSFELWTPKGYTGSYSGEIQDKPKQYNTVGFSPLDTKASRLFHFHSLSASVAQVVIQVSTSPFPAQGGGWSETPNLVYEKSYNLPTNTYAALLKSPSLDQTYPATVAVPFIEFGPKAAELKPGEYIRYYVRGVAIKPSIFPGMIDTSYSKTVTVEYGYEPPIEFIDTNPKQKQYDNYVEMTVAMPQLRLKNYTPVEWEKPESLNHYIVFQKPTADQIKCRWKNTKTGEVLYPYNWFTQPMYSAQGIHTKADYEEKVIPRVLQVGTKVYFAPPQEKDKAWYEELFDGIVNFFKDLWHVLQTIVNQVSAAYEGLKTKFIDFVVKLCPFPELQGYFRTALEGLVNYGLVAAGLPPSLPNFDDLTEMNLDYLAATALTEAGVPSNKFTQDLVKDVAKGIGQEIDKAANHADNNPINSPFLQLDPERLYRPAYVEVEMYNDTSFTTVPGTFDLNVNFKMNYYNRHDPVYGLNLAVATNYSPGSSPGIGVYNEYSKHFENGLNGNTVNYAQAGEAIYDVFVPVVGQKVPRLYPGEHKTLRLYLTPLRGGQMPLYPTGDNLRDLDFENMYFHNGNKKFTYFKLEGRFPTAAEYLMQQPGMFYLDPNTCYYYPNSGNTSENVQKPVSSGWSK